MPVTADGAQAINAKIPLMPLGSPARALIVAQPEARVAAMDCLARAVYYEARSEPLSGQRAVAQVVLNRARHPAFPSTICGVVYQGSERSTGCQFTFTCDGSQAVRPSGVRWSQAINVATRALDGFVERGVGWATHYHADYVVPYWASDLDKIASIGRHVFYRWSRGWGTSSAFRQRYSAAEVDPMAAIGEPLLIPMNATDLLPETVLSETPVVRRPSPIRADDIGKIEGEKRARLAADDAAPTLRDDLQGKPVLDIDQARNR